MNQSLSRLARPLAASLFIFGLGLMLQGGCSKNSNGNGGGNTPPPSPLPAPIPVDTPTTKYMQIGGPTVTGSMPDTPGSHVTLANLVEYNARLAEGDKLRFTFQPKYAGIYFRLRLAVPPPGGLIDPFSAHGAHPTVFQIPPDGNFDITLRAAEFGLTPQELAKTVQIQMRSGSNAWPGVPLPQTEDKKADFAAIYRITTTSAASTAPAAHGPAQPVSAPTENSPSTTLPTLNADEALSLSEGLKFQVVSPNSPSTYVPLDSAEGDLAIESVRRLIHQTDAKDITAEDLIRSHGNATPIQSE